MAFSKRRYIFTLCLLAAASGAAISSLGHSAFGGSARAETVALGGDSFLVKGDDGYGVGDCIRSGDECAKIVADAWCSAHGHGASRAFGPARDNLTASIAKISALRAPRIGEDDVFIACAP